MKYLEQGYTTLGIEIASDGHVWTQDPSPIHKSGLISIRPSSICVNVGQPKSRMHSYKRRHFC